MSNNILRHFPQVGYEWDGLELCLSILVLNYKAVELLLNPGIIWIYSEFRANKYLRSEITYII